MWKANQEAHHCHPLIRNGEIAQKPSYRSTTTSRKRSCRHWQVYALTATWLLVGRCRDASYRSLRERLFHALIRRLCGRRLEELAHCLCPFQADDWLSWHRWRSAPRLIPAALKIRTLSETIIFSPLPRAKFVTSCKGVVRTNKDDAWEAWNWKRARRVSLRPGQRCKSGETLPTVKLSQDSG